jgi:hypothetical protein
LIKELEEEKSELDCNNINNTNMNKALPLSPRLPKISSIKLIKEKLLNPSKTYGSFSQLRTSYKNKSLRMVKEYFNRDESKIDKKELKQAKKIKLSKPKVFISQKYLEKYHNSDKAFKEKLDKLSNLLKSKKNKKDENQDLNFSPYKLNIKDNLENINQTTLSKKKRKVRVGEIISQSNLRRLQSYFKDNTGYNDVRLPLDKNNILSFNFRSKYENKKEAIDNLYIILNKSINSDRTNLINYLKSKKNISPYFFNNLSKYDEAQIYKLNKMCGILLSEEKNKTFSKNKLISKYKKNKSFGFSSNGLSSLLKKSNKILNDYTEYKKNQDKALKKGFKDKLKDTKRKYWDKFNIKQLFNKKYELNESYIDEYSSISNSNY